VIDWKQCCEIIRTVQAYCAREITEPRWQTDYLSWSKLSPSWNLFFHNSSPSLGPIQSRIISVHIVTPRFFKLHFYIIFSSMPRFTKWPLCRRGLKQKCVFISYLPHLYYMHKPLLVFLMWSS